MIEVGRTQHALHQDCTVMLNVNVRDRPYTSTVLTVIPNVRDTRTVQ